MRTTPRFMLSSAAIGVVLLASTGQLAAAQSERPDHHPVFDRIDTNHDSQVSLAEWQAWLALRHERKEQHRALGPAPTMESQNHAGGAPAGADATAPPTGPGSPGAGSGHARQGGHGERLFARIDTNHDGAISLQEWVEFREAHHHQHASAGGTRGTTLPTTSVPISSSASASSSASSSPQPAPAVP